MSVALRVDIESSLAIEVPCAFPSHSEHVLNSFGDEYRHVSDKSVTFISKKVAQSSAENNSRASGS